MKKKNILENDSTLRLIFAFNDFTATNSTWEEESVVTRKNRQIASKITKSNEVAADNYFVFDSKFYAVNYEKQANGLIECEMQEYDKYYDLADQYLSMRFSFNPSTRMIERLDNVVVLPNIDLISQDMFQKKLNVA